MDSIKQYFSATRTLLFSFIFSLPLFFFYEVLIIASQPDTEQLVRISIDVWIKTLFIFLGVDAVSFSFVLIIVAGIIILTIKRHQLKLLNFRYFPALILESLVLAVVVAFISSSLTNLLVNISTINPIDQLTYLQKLALSLGAGLYEEFFFRVVLVSLFSYLLQKIVKKKNTSIFISIILSAMLFSAVHYIGSLGDFFTLNSFLFRFIFGLILNIIYVTRGFGVAAWTHALYDVLVITFL